MTPITISNILLAVVFLLAVISLIFYEKIVLLSVKVNTTDFSKNMVLNDNDNSKPSHSALIIIAFIAGLTILLNVINNAYNNKKTANVIVVISMIIMITVSIFGIINFSRLRLDQDNGASAALGPVSIKAGSKAPVLIEISTYLTFVMAILTSLYNGGIATNFMLK
jgi:hypothetical protein